MEELEPDTAALLDLRHAAPPTRRPRRSACRCACWVSLAVAGAFVLILVLGALYGAYVGVKTSMFPHAEYLQNKTSSTLPVMPLVSREQTFDIAASVWLRPTEDEIAASKAQWEVEDAVAGAGVVEDTGEEKGSGREEVATKLGELIKEWEYQDREVETPLFSDIVFRGVRLTDKNVFVDVPLQIPTARFCAVNLTDSDLRASFVLIPTSPSPLDWVTKWSHWIPPSVVRKPQRTWPFPLGSTDTRGKSMSDYIVEARGLTIGLIQLRTPSDPSPHAQSNAVTVTGSDRLPASMHRPESPVALSDGVDDDDDDREEPPEVSLQQGNLTTNATSSIRHPYINTRTHLRVIDDQSHYDLKAFNKAHNDLKAKSCGQDFPGKRPNRRLCDSSYAKVGPFGTRIRLSIPQEDGTFKDQRVYAPSVLPSFLSTGVLDLVSIPVNRTKFTAEATAWNSSTGVDRTDCLLKPSVNVTWHVSFSGRTLAKSWIADTMLQLMHQSQVGMNATELQKARQRDSLEVADAFGGHKYHPKAHPRRRFIIDALSTLSVVPAWVLAVHYWYSRVSTIGISVVATLGLSVTPILLVYGEIIPDILSLESTLPKVFGILAALAVVPVILLPCILALFTVSGMTLTWPAGGTARLPRVGRIQANHWERATQRLDRKTSWVHIGTLFSGLLALDLLPATHLDIVPSLLPAATALDKAHRLRKHLKYEKYVHAAGGSVLMTAEVIQSLLNHRSQIFGGEYRSAAFLAFAQHVINIARLTPLVSGVWSTRPGWTVWEAVAMGLSGWRAWQAWTLRHVPGDGPLEEE